MNDRADGFAPEDPIRRVPHLEGERAISPVAGRFGGKGGKAVTMAALVAGCAVFIAATWSDGDKAKDDPDPAPARQVVPYEGPEPPPIPTLANAANDPNAPSLTATGAAGADGPPAQTLAGAPTQAETPEAQRAAALSEAARRAPLIAYSVAASSTHASGTEMAEPARPRSSSPGGATELDRLRRSSSIGEARAAHLPDRNFLIVAGANIPCVLQTAMDTSTPGYVTCVIPKDIYSDNGAVVLMEKGTRVLGEYQAGMRQGQKRLFVLWVRAVTPTGVAINVGSPASDSLGRAGIDGEVNSHFWGRFGGALMLTIVDGGIAAATSDQNQYPGVVRLPSDAAGIALENSINIPPTLRKAQGTEVSIFVAQDLNFASVYELQAR
ncbi:type IV secretion system protein VirB10 [Phenylobacterium sp. LjRoot219]|uniref:type IV secretion system protein VirB10 n=1 Tax=Phenylobacterium sp. LjRoot219 TaxID=3342283 RepID=UPI003ED13B29